MCFSRFSASLFQMIGPVSPQANATLKTSPAAIMNNNNNNAKSSPGRRNKRKPLEPKKVHVATHEDGAENASAAEVEEAAAAKRRRLGSTGSSEDQHTRSPASGHSLSADDGQQSRSPSPSADDKHHQSMPMAPKMRFKQQHQQERQQQEDLAKSITKSPFRPWDSEDKPSATPSPPAAPLTPAATSTAAAASNALPAALTQQLAALPHLTAAAATLPSNLGYLSPELCLRLSSLGPSLLQHLSSSPEVAARAAQAMAAAAAAAAITPATPPSSSGSASPPIQDEPLALVKKRDSSPQDKAQTPTKKSSARKSYGSSSAGSGDEEFATSSNAGDVGDASPGGKGKQRNYKNMTRERRVEANARERQRVHTITAAFDTLQAAIPTGLSAEQQAQQKLSKLSIIKIATAYIMVLSRMAGHDYSADKSAPPVDECIDQCHQLIESETKFRKGGSVGGRAP